MSAPQQQFPPAAEPDSSDDVSLSQHEDDHIHAGTSTSASMCVLAFVLLGTITGVVLVIVCCCLQQQSPSSSSSSGRVVGSSAPAGLLEVVWTPPLHAPSADELSKAADKADHLLAVFPGLLLSSHWSAMKALVKDILKSACAKTLVKIYTCDVRSGSPFLKRMGESLLQRRTAGDAEIKQEGSWEYLLKVGVKGAVKAKNKTSCKKGELIFDPKQGLGSDEADAQKEAALAYKDLEALVTELQNDGKNNVQMATDFCERGVVEFDKLFTLYSRFGTQQNESDYAELLKENLVETIFPEIFGFGKTPWKKVSVLYDSSYGSPALFLAEGLKEATAAGLEVVPHAHFAGPMKMQEWNLNQKKLHLPSTDLTKLSPTKRKLKGGQSFYSFPAYYEQGERQKVENKLAAKTVSYFDPGNEKPPCEAVRSSLDAALAAAGLPLRLATAKYRVFVSFGTNQAHQTPDKKNRAELLKAVYQTAKANPKALFFVQTDPLVAAELQQNAGVGGVDLKLKPHTLDDATAKSLGAKTVFGFSAGDKSVIKNIVGAERWPQRDMLLLKGPQKNPLFDLFVSHGGMTSIVEGILGGVPMLIAPNHAGQDQYANADEVRKLGFGDNLQPWQTVAGTYPFQKGTNLDTAGIPTRIGAALDAGLDAWKSKLHAKNTDAAEEQQLRAAGLSMQKAAVVNLLLDRVV